MESGVTVKTHIGRADDGFFFFFCMLTVAAVNSILIGKSIIGLVIGGCV